ncbi:hypothetical protein FRC12_014883 [Ceratobasidium sp. 428]|nr:hypothetical protein FRC12_014883 [Ceratobasidium sp. 428]
MRATCILFAVFVTGGLASSTLPGTGGDSVPCNLLVKDDHKDLGYIGSVWNLYGQYGTLQPDALGALEVEFSYDPTSPKRLNVWTTNGPENDLPVFGAETCSAMGFSTDGVDMNPGNMNYAYIVGTALAGPDSSVVSGPNSFTDRTGFDAPIQSSIWQYDPVTGALSPQWANSDSSTPETHTLYAENEQTLLITSDPTALAEAMGTSYREVVIAYFLDDLLIYAFIHDSRIQNRHLCAFQGMR